MKDFIATLAAQGSFEIFEMFLSAALKATLLIAFASLLCRAVRRLSASTRHLIWTCALCASLTLPFLSSLEVYEISLLRTETSTIKAANSNELQITEKSFEAPRHSPVLKTSRNSPPAANTPEPRSFIQINFASFLPQTVILGLAVWAGGALLLLFRLSIGLTATASLLKRSCEFKNASGNKLFSSLLDELNLKSTIRLRRSERTTMPIVCGILRPAVLLPASAEEWSAERLRLVLLHELAHVARRDCLTQIMAQLACAFYWFNPLVWHAARQARIEREKACDEQVIRVGEKPSDYAEHLLEIARAMQEQRRSMFDWTTEASVAMAQQSQLENRLIAILSRKNELGGIFATRAVSTSLVALIAVSLVSLAAVRPTIVDARSAQTSRLVSSEEKSQIVKTPGDAVQSGQKVSPQTQENSGDFIDEMASAGYANLSVDELVKLKSAGVTANYIKSLHETGSVNFTIEEIALLSGYNVSPKFILEARSRLENPSVKEIVALKRQSSKNDMPLPPPLPKVVPVPLNPPAPGDASPEM